MKVEWKIAVAYLRRSTKKQEASIEQQRKTIEKYARDPKHKYRIIAWYIDDGISGDDTERRTAFLRMRDDAASGKFQHILCWDQDRFGRFDSLDAGYWIYPFRQARVSLVTTNDGPIDWDDFSGRTLYALKQEAKHQFLRDHSRDVVRGQVEAAKKGSWIGAAPYGYKVVGEKTAKKLEVEDPAKLKIVKRIFHEYVVGDLSLHEIAQGLNRDKVRAPKSKAWRYDGVKSILRNPAYLGMTCFNRNSNASYYSYDGETAAPGAKVGPNPIEKWITKENTHPAIIEKRTFDLAQARIAKGKTGRSTRGVKHHLLAGKLRCSKCKAVMWGATRKRRGKSTTIYECSNHQQHGDSVCVGTVVSQDRVLHEISLYVNDEILACHDEDLEALWDKAKAGELTAHDLPKGFKKLKALLMGPALSKGKGRNFKKEIEQLDLKIEKATSNLPFVDREFIEVTQRSIRELRSEREALVELQRNQPTEQDINQSVLAVLSSMLRLWGLEPERMKPVIRQIDHIAIETRKSGKGVSTRHRFHRGEIHFAGSGGPAGAFAGDPIVTSKLNLRLLVQSQAAYR